jgi:hypothetical protein
LASGVHASQIDLPWPLGQTRVSAMSDQDRTADEMAILLAARPNVLAKLLDAHRDDGRGHCRVCAIGGQRGFQRWPCNIAAVARQAARIRETETPR